MSLAQLHPQLLCVANYSIYCRNSGIFWSIFHMSGVIGNIFVMMILTDTLDKRSRSLVRMDECMSVCDITDDCLDCCVPTGHHKHWDCFYDFLPVVYPSLHHRYCISQYPQTTPVVLYCRRGERGIPSHLVSPLQQEDSPACATIPADRTHAGSPISHTEVNIAKPRLQLCWLA